MVDPTIEGDVTSQNHRGATPEQLTAMLNHASTLSANLRRLNAQLDDVAAGEGPSSHSKDQDAVLLQNAKVAVLMQDELLKLCEFWLARKILNIQPGDQTIWVIICRAVDRTVSQTINGHDAEWRNHHHFLKFAKENIRRCLLDLIRRRKERQASDSQFWTSLTANSRGDDRWQQIEFMLETIKKLPQDEQELITRRYFMEETQRSIGQSLGLSDKDVSIRINRIYKKLHELMSNPQTAI